MAAQMVVRKVAMAANLVARTVFVPVEPMVVMWAALTVAVMAETMAAMRGA